jgi:hypothetical protein
MSKAGTFQRRGIVEGFFGPPWSMSHRKALFEFGAARGMNTYLYAPKDDPYHREHWTKPYPAKQWQALLRLIREAQKHGIDFVYGFHPGKGLSFSNDKPVRILLAKARRFYDAGVRTFAVLFDDIPSRLEFDADRKSFQDSLAHAEGTWLQKIQERQPADWKGGSALPIIPPTLFLRVLSGLSSRTFSKPWRNIYRQTSLAFGRVRQWCRNGSVCLTFKGSSVG